MKSFRLVRGLGVAVAVGAVMSGVSQSGAEVEKSATGLDSVGIPLGVDAANRSVQDGLIDWKITYEQPLDEPGTVTLRDAVTGAQSYQPGSLKVPTDWTPGEVANPDGTTTLTATNPLVAPGGRGVAAELTKPVTTSFSQTSSGGDGFRPIIWTNPDDPADRRIYTVFHHTGDVVGGSATASELWCVELPAGAACPGFPKRYEPDTPGFVATGRMGSPWGPREVRRGTRIYFPYADATTYGVGCLDLLSGNICDYLPLSDPAVPEGSEWRNDISTNGATYPWSPFVFGFQEAADGRFYGMAYDTTAVVGNRTVGSTVVPIYDGRVVLVCFEVDAMLSAQPCADSNLVTLAPDGSYAVPTPLGGVHAQLEVDGMRGYTVNLIAGSAEIGCIELPVGNRCAGWTQPRILGTNVSNAYAFLPGGPGRNSDVCLRWGENPTGRYVRCFDRNGSPTSLPVESLEQLGWQAAVSTGDISLFPSAYVTELNRTYFPLASDGAICWDWGTNSLCDGFNGHFTANGLTFYPADYGYAYDPITGCMWGNGDAGNVWSFDPYTGASPCVRSRSTTETVTPSASYCDGSMSHVSGWGRATVHNAQGLTELRLTVRDQDGVVVPGWDHRVVTPAEAAAGVDLSSIDIGAYPQISVELDVGFSDVSWWTDAPGVAPTVSVTFEGDPVEMCFRSYVLDRCETTSLDNSVSAVVRGVHSGAEVSESGSKSMVVDRRAHACPDLVIDKSVEPERFDPGSTLYYSLEVTNQEKPDPAQGTDAVDVVVRDVLPAGVAYVVDRVAAAEGTAPVYDAETRTLTWTIPGPIDPDESVVLTYPVVVVDPEAVSLANTAVITGVGSTPVPSPEPPGVDVACVDIRAYDGVSGPCDEVGVERAYADVSVDKDVLTRVVRPGGVVEWRITARNLGPDIARDVVVVDELPEGFVLDSMVPSSGACELVAVSCALGDVESGSSVTVVVSGRVDLGYSAEDLSNRVVVATSTTDPDPGNNSDVETVPVVPLEEEFSITKASSASAVRTSDEIVYTVKVTNKGEKTSSPEVVEVPGAGLVLLGMSSPDGRCDVESRSCELAELAPGEVAVVWVLAKVESGFTGSMVENSAKVRRCCGDSVGDVKTASYSVSVLNDPNVLGAVQSPLARTGQRIGGLVALATSLVLVGDLLRRRGRMRK